MCDSIVCSIRTEMACVHWKAVRALFAKIWARSVVAYPRRDVDASMRDV